MSTPVLEVRNIAKQYPGVRALDGVDFDVLRRRGPRACSAPTAPGSRR